VFMCMFFLFCIYSSPYDIDADTICCLCVCADVAPRGREVELQRALERPPRGERRWWDDAAV
jgi:hypothetical protein